jgi:hypothetical protein
MRLNPADLLRHSQPEEPLAPAPLGGSGSQSMQRLQVGLFGLAAMVLLVGLANIIMTNARQNAAQVVPEAGPTAASGAEAAVNDPLADAGVVPNMPAAAQSPAARTGDAAVGSR